MKTFSVYLYFPASDLEIQVRAESLEEAAAKAETNGHKLLANGVSWNDSTGIPVHVTEVIEQGKLK